jgi:hypothetical protein
MEGTEKEKSTGKLERELPVPCARGQLEQWALCVYGRYDTGTSSQIHSSP